MSNRKKHFQHGREVIEVRHIPTKMPRFRKKKPDITLTEMVRKVLNRAASNPNAFAVFFFNDRLKGRRPVFCDMGTDRFKAFERNYPKALIGTYDRYVSAPALMDDLQEFFAVEVDA